MDQWYDRIDGTNGNYKSQILSDNRKVVSIEHSCPINQNRPFSICHSNGKALILYEHVVIYIWHVSYDKATELSNEDDNAVIDSTCS